MARVIAGDICHYLATKINKDEASASDSSDNESDEDTVEVIDQESKTESDDESILVIITMVD